MIRGLAFESIIELRIFSKLVADGKLIDYDEAFVKQFLVNHTVLQDATTKLKNNHGNETLRKSLVDEVLDTVSLPKESMLLATGDSFFLTFKKALLTN